MATGPGVNQGKGKFLEEFLPGNRDADEAAINQAWRAEGHDDDISGSLVSKTRSRLKIPKKRGATGGADAGSKAKGKAKSKGTKGKAKQAEAITPQPADREGDTGPSKSAFVGELLGRQPEANVAAVNRAWSEAGHEGEISPSVFYKIKRERGGNGGGTTSASVKAKAGSESEGPDVGQATVEARPELYGETVLPPVSGSESNDRERVLDRVEDGIDDLIIELKRLGGMEAALESLRKVRRVVVRSHEG